MRRPLQTAKQKQEIQAVKNKARRLLIRGYTRDYKSSRGCMDCKVSYPYYCLDFDHVRGQKKKFNVSDGSSGWSLGAVKLEIEKCDVVCRNCHAARTFKRNLLAHEELQNAPIQPSGNGL